MNKKPSYDLIRCPVCALPWSPYLDEATGKTIAGHPDTTTCAQYRPAVLPAWVAAGAEQLTANTARNAPQSTPGALNGTPATRPPAETRPPSAGQLADRWQDRLAFDSNVSERSPVVKGTWCTVSHIVSLIIDGWTWGDILRAHPELCEDDIRTCLAFAVAEDEGVI